MRRLVTLILLAALLATSPAVVAGPRRPPLILVNGFLFGPALTWGIGQRTSDGSYIPLRGSSLFNALLQEGYVPGESLFIFEPSGDYVAAAPDFLAFAAEVRRRTGADRVDVVTHGSGALVVRYAALEEDPRIRALVMLAPPNHGTFLASALYAAAITERCLELDPRQRARLRDPDYVFDLSDPVPYIWRRAEAIYQPAFRRYLVEVEFVPSPLAAAVGRGLAFEHWLAQQEIYEENILRAQEPLSQDGKPSEFTAAYYDLLAVIVARTAFMREIAGTEKGGVIGALSRPRVPAGDLKQVLYDYLLQVVRLYANRLWQLLQHRGASLLAVEAARLAGIEGDGPAVRRLVQEEVAFPVGRDGAGREIFDIVKANHFLAEWNRRSWETAAGEGSGKPLKSAIVAGRAYDLFGEVARGVGHNDRFVEVEATFRRPHLDDHFFVYEHPFAATFLGLTRQPGVIEYVLGHLRDIFPSRLTLEVGARRPWSRTIDGSASFLAPVYYRFTGQASLQGLTFTVKADEGGPPGSRVALWAYAEGPWGVELVGRTEGSDVVTLTGLRLPPGAEGLIVGVRALHPDLAPATLHLFEGKVRPFQLTAVMESPLPAGDLEAEEAAPEEDVVVLPQPVETQPAFIEVIRKSRMTTRKREDRTYHVRWEWDFGDGTVSVDDDPAHTRVQVTHTFPSPGRYVVRATSYSNEGRPLRRKEWTVEVSPGDLVRTFYVETVEEPRVELELKGPMLWVTGRPANFQVVPHITAPPHAERVTYRCYPSDEFTVVWNKPGTFTVRAAVTVKTNYVFPDQRITTWNTYVVTREVKVATTSISD